MSAGETVSDSLVIRPGRRLRYLYVLQAIAAGFVVREADERYNVGEPERTFARRVDGALEQLPEDLKQELHEKKQTYFADESLDFPFAFDRDEARLAAEAIWAAHAYTKRTERDGRSAEEDEPVRVAYAFIGTLMQHAG